MAKTAIPDMHSLKESLGDLKGQLAELEEQIDDKVSKNPKKSLLIAFGAGILAGVVALSLLKQRK